MGVTGLPADLATGRIQLGTSETRAKLAKTRFACKPSPCTLPPTLGHLPGAQEWFLESSGGPSRVIWQANILSQQLKQAFADMEASTAGVRPACVMVTVVVPLFVVKSQMTRVPFHSVAPLTKCK